MDRARCPRGAPHQQTHYEEVEGPPPWPPAWFSSSAECPQLKVVSQGDRALGDRLARAQLGRFRPLFRPAHVGAEPSYDGPSTESVGLVKQPLEGPVRDTHRPRGDRYEVHAARLAGTPPARH